MLLCFEAVKRSLGERLRGCRALVKSLQAYDVKYVFGLPGDTSVTLYDEFRKAEPDIHHIMTRDERNAAFMADAYARVAYRPGVCDAPSGGGALYMVPGVSEANNSSIPLIALTTEVSIPYMERGTLTELDQVALFKPVTKWNTLVKKASLIPQIVRKAFREATTGRPGAVHLSLPSDVLGEEIEEDVEIYSEEACKEVPSYRVYPDKESVRKAVSLLLSAEKPVIIAGGGALLSKAWDEVTELAELIVAPVATTLTGKGIIPENHPLSLGVVGDNGGKEYVNEIVRESDLVMFVGCKTGSVATIKWTLLGDSTKLIHVDVDPREIGKNYRIEVGVVGDAKCALRLIIDAIKEKAKKVDRPERLEEIKRKAEEWWDEAESRMDSPPGRIKPQRLVRELRKTLPKGSTLVIDAGTPTPYTAAYYPILEPGRRIVIARAHGEIGYALPGSIGAKLADPGRPTFALCGDGSFVIALGELETVSRVRAPLTLIVFNNGCYSWIKTLQHIYCDKRYYEVDFTDVDYCKIAEGFNLIGKRVEEPEKLEKAFKEALNSDVPTVIEVPVVPMHVEIPPVATWVDLTKKK